MKKDLVNEHIILTKDNLMMAMFGSLLNAMDYPNGEVLEIKGNTRRIMAYSNDDSDMGMKSD